MENLKMPRPSKKEKELKLQAIDNAINILRNTSDIDYTKVINYANNSDLAKEFSTPIHINSMVASKITYEYQIRKDLIDNIKKEKKDYTNLIVENMEKDIEALNISLDDALKKIVFLLEQEQKQQDIINEKNRIIEKLKKEILNKHENHI